MALCLTPGKVGEFDENWGEVTLITVTTVMRYCKFIDSLVGLLISTPSLGVYYCQEVILSACPSVCVSQPFKLHLPSFFVSRWNRAIF